MTRIKSSVTQSHRHNKIRKANSGYKGTKSRLYKVGHEAYLHAGQYSYAGRKKKKRDFRRNWILNISEAVKPLGLSYSKFINKLKIANITIDRKIMADLIVSDPESFKALVEKSKSAASKE